MSGIGGILYLDKRLVQTEQLSAMIASLAHRGKEGASSLDYGSVGFIHCMMYTTPESCNETLPYRDPESGIIITADVRLDNRVDLSTEIGLPELKSQGLTDSLILLEAYKKWGHGCAARLLGDFAFAIWDPRERMLFCARDHMGIKPFYYHYSKENVFVFGSEIKAVFSAGSIVKEVDEQRILDYLVFYNSDRTSTFYKGILRLPARHMLRVGDDFFNVEPYWDFNPRKELRYQRQEEYAEAFQELFSQAVSCRLRSSFPIGAFLSGGIDSSSIVCVASDLLKKQGDGPLITFSEIFENLPPEQFTKTDERRYMEAVIAKCESEAHFVCITEQGPLQGLEDAVYDEPMPYFNGYLLDATCSKANERGVRILLDGTDGDTTVSHGYERLHHLGAEYRLFTLLAETAKICRRNNKPFKPATILWNYSLKHSIPSSLLTMAGKVLRRAEKDIAGLLKPEIAASVDWNQREAYLEKKLSSSHDGRFSQYLTFVSPLQQYTMEFIDSRSSHYPLEIRYPFWDRRLMEFCLALPLEQKLQDGLTRFVLRRAMRGILPQIVEERVGKADLSPHFLMAFSRTAAPLIDELCRQYSYVSKYIDASTIRNLWNDFKNNPYQKQSAAMDLYVVLSLELWLKKLYRRF